MACPDPRRTAADPSCVEEETGPTLTPTARGATYANGPTRSRDPIGDPTHFLGPAHSRGVPNSPRPVQPSQLQIYRLTIELGAFSPHFSTDLTFPNSNIAARVYHTSTTQEDTFRPSFSNPNCEQHMSRQVIELKNALSQQTTLVNQLLQRTKMQRAPDEVSQSRTRADDEPL
ncbi:hypothetical protein ACFX1T_003024 [Malus domestica]